MEMDFWLALKFWQTSWRQKWNEDPYPACALVWLLTLLGNIIEWSKEHFNHSPYPPFRRQSLKTGENKFITMSEVIKIVKMLLGGRVPEMDEIALRC